MDVEDSRYGGCFICDKKIVGASENIISAVTSHTDTPLIDKLRNFIGTDYIVIVSQDDRVCENCLSLFDKIDELEYNLKHFQAVLNDLLTKKYTILSNGSGDNNEMLQEMEEHHENATSEINENIIDCKKSLKTLKKSKKNINGEKDAIFFCSSCNVKISNKSSLKKHIVQTHIVEKESNTSDQNTNYECNKCLQLFLSEDECQDHVEKSHIDRLIVDNVSNSEILEDNIDMKSNKVVEKNIVLSNHGVDYRNCDILTKNPEIVIDNCNEPINLELSVIDSNNLNTSVELTSTVDTRENKAEAKCLTCSLINEMMSGINTILGRDNNNLLYCAKCSKNQNLDYLENQNRLKNLLSDLIKSEGKTCQNSLMKCLNSFSNKISTIKSSQFKDEIVRIENTVGSDVTSSTLISNIEHLIGLFNDRVTERFKDEVNIDENTKVNSENSCNDDKQGTYDCVQCNFTFKTELSLFEHLKETHKKDVLVCVVCNLIFNDSEVLNAHVLESHPDWDNSSYCQSCNKNYDKKSDLINHIKCIHLRERFCTICRKRFKNKALFLKHIEFGHRDDLHCRFCETLSNDLEELIVHELSHSRKEFVCEICCKTLKTRSGLKAHKILLHTGEYPYICEVCGKGFISTHTLNEHKGNHSQESRYICDICGKGYRLYDTYHKHRNHHDNPYPKQCNICHQFFRSSSRLAEHKRRKHTLERPYKCPHCSLSFHISSLLRHHLFKHTRQYPYTCVTCKKGFPSRIKYASHMAKKHKDDSLIKNRFPNNKERQEEWLKCSRKNP